MPAGGFLKDSDSALDSIVFTDLTVSYISYQSDKASEKPGVVREFGP